MGGIIATARQWADFEAKFTAAKMQYGFNIFHTKKFKSRSGDFVGWSHIKRSSLYWDLASLSSNAFIEGVALHLDNAGYEEYYKAGDKPRRARLDSKYGLCFRTCLYFFIMEGLKRKHRDKYPKLHIVLESGHVNAGDAVRVFNEVRKEFEHFDMLETITLADKDKCDPLMMADFIAHSSYLIDLKERAGTPRQPSQPVPRGQSGITHLVYTPGAFAEIKRQIVAKVMPKHALSVPS
jgi:hypothetical protein